MNVDEFHVFWDRYFGLCPPIGYRLRQVYHDRWFRIHTLPESKRYAETEDEYQEILRRHNSIVDDILRGSSGFVLLVTNSSFDEKPQPLLDLDTLGLISAELVFCIAMHDLEGEDEPWYWHVWMCNREWTPNCLDPLLRLVADDEIRNAGIVNTEYAALYFPYDGGGDVILNSSVDREHMRKKYTNWLSKHPEGL